MQAMCLEHPAPVEDSPLRLTERPLPDPEPGEMLVRVRGCGVCHTDLHTVEGDLELPRLPLVPGHQVVGTVERVGPDVKRFRIGERVGAAWLHEACGRCRFCRTGRENLCPEARFTGLSVDGGYAEYLRAKADFAYRIPPGYTDHEAAPLLCAGIIGYRALRLSRIERGARLGLFGFGASAHIAIQVARHWGCRVYVFTRAAAHRRLAEQLGAAWVGGAEDDPGAPLDGAVIFAPAGQLVPLALERLDRGGTLALAGITMTSLPGMDYRRHLYHERAVVSVANATRRDGEDLMKLAGEIRLRTRVEVFPLAEANRVLRLLKQSRIEASAVLEVRSSL